MCWIHQSTPDWMALPKAAKSSAAQFSNRAASGQTTAPRSSNLRLHKEFTEVERDRFLDEAFEFIAPFFEGSLAELEKRNPGIETRFKRIDAQAFGAVIYRKGKAVARCGVRHRGGRGFGKGITFTHDESAPTNTLNESLSVEAGEQSLFLKPMEMQMYGRPDRDAHLTPEGAAEYYWSLLIEPLQR